MDWPKINSKLTPFMVFLGLWGFHLFSSGGTLIPYRDTGEMVTNAYTLGVAHPPGYPFYTLLGHLMMKGLWGNPSYCLNLLSGLSSSLLGVVIFRMVGILPAVLWATAPIFWELSSVSEMYTLALLGVALVFLLVQKLSKSLAPGRSQWILLFFLLGLGTGVRTDFALLGPGLLYVLWMKKKTIPLMSIAVFFILGLSVYLYLPVRSYQGPWIDWNNPEILQNFLGSLLRKTHGGTLDLLSQSYGKGQNFLAGWLLFLKSSAGVLAWFGIPFFLLGIRWTWKNNKVFLIFLLMCLGVTGPIFIYLANMPPNPHAVAILEAHFLIPQLILILLMGFGFKYLLQRQNKGFYFWGLVFGGLLMLTHHMTHHQAQGHKRWNMVLRDYSTNVLRSSEKNSIGVLREDVQLFSLWERTLVSQTRPDFNILAQGLSRSPWYLQMIKQQGVRIPLGALKNKNDWGSFSKVIGGRSLWVGGDVSGIIELPKKKNAGLLLYVGQPINNKSQEFPLQVYVQRGKYIQNQAPDFFSGDIISEYSRSFLRHASNQLRRRNWELAHTHLKWAQRLDPESPTVLFNRGYLLFENGKLEEAERLYASATRVYDILFRRAEYYKSLPEVVQGLKKESSEIWVHRGVVADRQDRVDVARQCYRQAIHQYPGTVQAHTNLAITYWNKDWDLVLNHLEDALQYDPQDSRIQKYYFQAKTLKKRQKS